MLERIHLQNYRCFDEVSLELGKDQVLIGYNGVGKSSLIDALDGVWRLSYGLADAAETFPSESRTRWLEKHDQTIELRLQAGGRSYRYLLEVAHPLAGRSVILREVISDDDSDRLLVRSNGRRASLFDRSSEETLLTDRRRSVLASISEDDKDRSRELRNIIAVLKRVYVARIDPRAMKSTAESDFDYVRSDFSNLATWIRHFHTNAKATAQLTRNLRDFLPGLVGFHFRPLTRDQKQLDLKFREGRRTYSVSLDELSDGQRVLVALYTLLFNTAQDPHPWTICLDEPDNYLALPEIQPLLVAFQEQPNVQLIVASHHPEIVDHLGAEHGILFRRDARGRIAAGPFTAPAGELVRASEWLARGNIDGAPN